MEFSVYHIKKADSKNYS